MLSFWSLQFPLPRCWLTLSLERIGGVNRVELRPWQTCSLVLFLLHYRRSEPRGSQVRGKCPLTEPHSHPGSQEILTLLSRGWPQMPREPLSFHLLSSWIGAEGRTQGHVHARQVCYVLDLTGNQGCWDGSAGIGGCHQAWTELDPRSPHGKREKTSNLYSDLLFHEYWGMCMFT